jgi:hypothetical protein
MLCPQSGCLSMLCVLFNANEAAALLDRRDRR